MDTKTKLIIGGLVITILIVLVIGKSLGWFTPKLKLKDGDGDVDLLPGGGIDESRYRSIAKTVRDSLEGLNYQTSYFSDVADQLLSLNKNELRLTSNIFNRDFSDSTYPTIRSRVGAELVGASWGLLGLIPTPCSQWEILEIASNCYKQNLVLERLNEINA